MSLVTVIWSMIAAACLTLAVLSLSVWFKNRRAWDHLLFVSSALAAAALAGFELCLTRAATPSEYGAVMRWGHVPFTILVVSIVWFIRFHLHAGRSWLAWGVSGLRTLALALNFLFEPNLNFREITSLRRIQLLGEAVSVPVGVTNPWTLIGQLSLLLLLAFSIDATIAVWRRGDRRLALVVGGSAGFFIALSLLQTVLVIWGVVQAPFFYSLAYLGIILVMGHELSSRVLRAAGLARELQASGVALRESEQRMTLAAEAANLGFWVWDIARNDVWASDPWRALFGFAKTERLEFDRVLQRAHPDDRESVRQSFARALAGNDRYEDEYRLLLPGGPVRWIASRGAVERTSSGEPLRVRGVTVDITARKQAEEKFRLAVEASPSGVLLVDGEGRIGLVNAEAERLFGFARDELIGQGVEMLVPEQSRPSHPDHRAAFLAAPSPRPMGAGRELFARRKDGTEFPVEIALNPIQSAGHTIVLAAITDITARRHAEALAEHQRAELAHIARVATMGQLASSLAHELNQPLGAILRNAEAAQLLLQRDPVDVEEIRAILADICSDDQRAGAVVDRTRAMLARRDLVTTRLPVKDLVEDTLALIRSDAASRQVSVQVELAPGLPPICGDRVQLQQVILNLILNGMDAMVDSAAARRLVVSARQADVKTVELSVSDSGHGIPVDELAHVFDPFFTTKPKGLGMGLPISRTIIESHGGRLSAENNSDRGATFRFSVPIAEGSSP